MPMPPILNYSETIRPPLGMPPLGFPVFTPGGIVISFSSSESSYTVEDRFGANDHDRGPCGTVSADDQVPNVFGPPP